MKKVLISLLCIILVVSLLPMGIISNAASDSLTFSEMIEKWEVHKPIPEPDPEFKDVDGIWHLIKTWFGWICKALGIKNVYSQEYEKEVEKYAVQPPNEIDETVDESNYSLIFGKDGE